ncbi:MAG: terminase large subunit [Pseudomonadota bacterium]
MSDLSPAQFETAWNCAVPDWEDRIRQRRTLIPDLPIFGQVAEKALRIFKRLKVPDLIGNPTFGETCEPWVLDFVAAVFGSYDPSTKRRMIREFFLLVPKKNTKSTIAAGIMVTAHILNERPKNELALIAPAKDIADIAFGTARGIIELDPQLDALFHVRDHIKQIEHRVNGSVLKIVSADTVTGLKAAFVLIDESHELGSKPRAPKVYREARGGLASKPEGFFLQITTQSKKRPAGQFKKELQLARAVRDGKIEYSMLAVLYELPDEMAKDGGWKDPATWALVNPNLNVSVDLQFLHDQLRSAELAGQDTLAELASQHFNVQIGGAFGSWIASLFWGDAVDPALNLETLLERSEVVVIGGDVGGLDDLFSLGVIGREKDTKRWLGWTRSWCVEAVLEKRLEISPELQDFAADGDLRITPTTQEQVVEAGDICEQIRDAGLLPAAAAVGLDPYGAAALTSELQLRGFDENAQIVGISQGYKLTGAIKGMERRLLDGTFSPADQALSSWAVGNASAVERGNATLITKEEAGKSKIDPLIALLNGAQLMERNPVAHRTSIVIPVDYEF